MARAARHALTETQVEGLEHLPPQGPALLVVNHLGDADVVLLLSVLPWCPEVLASQHLQEEGPWLRALLQAYGVIWVYRGTADRAALKAALEALRLGRVLGLAPEGRQSLIGGLETGTPGAAYLALKSKAPVVPVAITGTENWAVFPRLKRGRRLHFTLRVGQPFFPQPQSQDRRQALQEVTEQIMLTLARLLPPEYRGVYADRVQG